MFKLALKNVGLPVGECRYMGLPVDAQELAKSVSSLGA